MSYVIAVVRAVFRPVYGSGQTPPSAVLMASWWRVSASQCEGR